VPQSRYEGITNFFKGAIGLRESNTFNRGSYGTPDKRPISSALPF
jgi:hypothetical protein